MFFNTDDAKLICYVVGMLLIVAGAVLNQPIAFLIGATILLTGFVIHLFTARTKATEELSDEVETA